MRVLIPAESPERVSTAVIGTVMVCHNRGFDFLGGMVPNLNASVADAQTHDDPSASYWMKYPGYVAGGSVGVRSRATRVMVFSGSVGEVEPEGPWGVAVRHLGELMGLGRDGKMRYLADAGMERSECAGLVSMVSDWLDEAGLDRLGELSQVAARWGLGPGHVLERWIDGICQLRLALLLEIETVVDPNLATAYAVSHAADLVLASYRSDVAAGDDVLSLVPGDDLD